MRHLFVLTLVVLAELSCLPLVAQTDDINPRLLMEQVRLQQGLVQTRAGSADSHAWLKLGVLLQDAGQYRESEVAYAKALSMMDPHDALVVADAQDHMGTMYMESSQLSKAETLEHEALKAREAANDSVGVGVSHTHLAALLMRQGKPNPAEKEARLAVHQLAPEVEGGAMRQGVSPEEKMTALINLSLIRCAQNDCRDAVGGLKTALGIAHENYSDNTVPVGYLECLLGNAYWKSGDAERAVRMMKSGTHELQVALGWGHPLYLRMLVEYEALLRQNGPAAEARLVADEIDRLESARDVARLEHPLP